MSISGAITGRANAGSGVVLMARVVGQADAYITQTTISSASYLVRDIDAGTSGANTTLAVGSVVFDTLQTGNGWDADAVGYNFRAVIPASSFAWTPAADVAANPKPHRFQIQIKFTPATGEPFVVIFGLHVFPVWSS